MLVKLSFIYTVICCLSPIFVIYSFIGNSITILDTFILVFYIVALPYLSAKKQVCAMRSFLFLFIFILFHSILYYLYNWDVKIFLRAMHMTNYVFFVALFQKRLFRIDLAKRIVVDFSVIATLFLLLQHIIYHFTGIPLPGILPAFAINEANLENQIWGSDVIRFASFFVEPAAYAVYIVCGLTQELIYKKKPRLSLVGFMVLGCVVSTSNTAIVCMILIVGLYFLKHKLISKGGILIIFFLFLILFFAGTFIDSISQRVESGSSFDGRFSGYTSVLSYVTNPIFGMGFLNPEELSGYFSGYARLYLYLGFSGIIVYLIFFISISSYTKEKFLFFLFLILNIGADTLFGVYFLFYCGFIIASHNYSYEKSICYNN